MGHLFWMLESKLETYLVPYCTSENEKYNFFGGMGEGSENGNRGKNESFVGTIKDQFVDLIENLQYFVSSIGEGRNKIVLGPQGAAVNVRVPTSSSEHIFSAILKASKEVMEQMGIGEKNSF